MIIIYHIKSISLSFILLFLLLASPSECMGSKEPGYDESSPLKRQSTTVHLDKIANGRSASDQNSSTPDSDGKPPKKSASCCNDIYGACSSSVRNPAFVGFYTFVLAGFTIYAAYKLYMITPIDNQNYPIASNSTASDEFLMTGKINTW